MVVLKMHKKDGSADGNNGAPDLKQEVAFRESLLEITNRVHAASNIDEILIDLKDDLTKLFDAERLTVYVVDGVKKELVSRVKSGDEISEIRVPISTESLVGYVAHKGELVNLKDVYDTEELSAIDPNLSFDKAWDQKSGYRTRQVLAAPISFQKYLLGAIQFINRKDGAPFSKQDEAAVHEVSKILGIAIYNQKRMAKARPGKYDYLVENGLLTQKELDKAVADPLLERTQANDRFIFTRAKTGFDVFLLQRFLGFKFRYEFFKFVLVLFKRVVGGFFGLPN